MGETVMMVYPTPLFALLYGLCYMLIWYSNMAVVILKYVNMVYFLLFK